MARLDKGVSRKRPDFAITRGRDQVIVEVKTIISGGRTLQTNGQKGGVALSTLDEGTHGQVVWFSGEDPTRKLRDLLGNASQKLQELIQDESKFSSWPYVVCTFDQFAFCHTRQILQDGFFGFNDIGAILLPVVDREKWESARKMSDAESDQYLRGEISLGPSTFEWRVVQNEQAQIRVEPSLFDPVI